MIKLAVSSDNHLDVNRIMSTRALHIQASWLLRHDIDYYLYAGDLYNNFGRTRRYFAALQRLVGERVQIYYVLGNHDMLSHASYQDVEHLADPMYLHNQYVDLPGTDWRLIGNNGWYDYSFSDYAQQPQQVAQWKKVYWVDAAIKQPMSDPQRMGVVLNQVEQQLTMAQAAGKKVIFLTHFAPRKALLSPKPSFVQSQRQLKTYQMINAMMGSERLGRLLEKAPHVKYVFYGHLHGIHDPLKAAHLVYFNQAVGVKKAKRTEWQYDKFAEQWEHRLKIIELNN